MKTVELKERPIYHRSADRVRAHVFLCLLAYYVEWHIAPQAGAGAVRRPRPRRWRAIAGVGGATGAAVTGGTLPAASKRTADDLPVHSFRGLMSEMGTLVLNEMQLAEGGDTFPLPPQPTPVQRRCFELLEVSPRM